MFRKIILALLMLIPMAALGQVSNPSIILVSTPPSGSCSNGLPDQQTIITGALYSCQSGTWAQLGGGGGGTGTVTSVTFTGDGVVDSSTPSSAVTASGTVTATIKNQSANTVLAGPTSGGAAAPSFQTAPTISAANMTSFPTLNQNTSGTASNLSGTPALPNGTTATTQTANDNSTKLATTAYVDGKTFTSALTTICHSTGLTDTISNASGTFATTCTVNANTMHAGGILHLQVGGTETALSGCNANFQYSIKEGTTTVAAAVGTTSSTRSTPYGLAINANFNILKTGASGILSQVGAVTGNPANAGGSFLYQEDNTGGGGYTVYALSTNAQDTTANQTFSIVLSATYVAGTCSSTITDFLLTLQQSY